LTLDIADLNDVVLQVAVSDGQYKITVGEHLDAIRDEEMLYASVLIHSYALAESIACDVLGQSPTAAGGIESWGERLLLANGKTWAAVKDGLAGAVEVAVVRNAFAHGTRRIEARMVKRLNKAGSPPRADGSSVSLTYEELRVYRARLRSLLRHGGLHG
jgi:hypothetical protein